ncbi:MAG: hypothetical protein U0230_08900 [Polyangiales bacterium]
MGFFAVLGLCACAASPDAIGSRESALDPCTDPVVYWTLKPTLLEKVDLLFLIDNSNSMASEQALLRQQFPRLVEGLVTGDPDLDPTTPNLVPVTSLRIGVIDSDMGVDGVGENAGEPKLPTCGYDPATGFDVERARHGDDGLLVRQARSTVSYRDSMGIVQTVPVADPTDATGATNLNCDFDGMGGDDLLTFATLPAFLSFDPPSGGAPSTTDVNAYVRRVACMTNVGTGGCGFEQQLESMLKAITPSASVPTGGAFYAAPTEPTRGSGHGDDPSTNGSWFRPDSLLALVLVSDEDDCSAKDRRVFDYDAAPPYDDPSANASTVTRGFQANTRCARFSSELPARPPSLLHDVARYVDGIVAMRPRPDSIVFAAITGVPHDLTDGQPGSAAQVEGIWNLSTLLDDPRMQYTLLSRSYPLVRPVTIDEAALGYACVLARNADLSPAAIQPSAAEVATYSFGPYDTAATPGRRIVRVAEGLQQKGVDVFVQSICAPSFQPAIEGFVQIVGQKLGDRCLPAALARDTTGEVRCDVLEELPAGTTCAELADRGREAQPLRQTLDHRDVCRVVQLPVDSAALAAHATPTGLGWFYDDHTDVIARSCPEAMPRRIAFTAGAEPTVGGRLSLACLDTVSDGGRPVAPDASYCDAGTVGPDGSVEDGGSPDASIPPRKSSQCGVARGASSGTGIGLVALATILLAGRRRRRRGDRRGSLPIERGHA